MTTTLFTTLAFRDVEAAITWLTAIGFTEKGIYRDDTGKVVHAQFDWGGAGGIMFGQANDDDPHKNRAGKAACYLVVPTDADVDDVHAKGVAAGGKSVAEPTDMDYGGRGATVEDPEGNQFSIGSYPGA